MDKIYVDRTSDEGGSGCDGRGVSVRLTSLAANCTTAEKGAFSGTVTLHAQEPDQSAFRSG
jgi:hypothetical protein